MRHFFRRGVLSFLAVFFLTTPLQAATFTVNSTGDEPDLDPFGSDTDGLCLTAIGTCTLRAALREAAAASGSEIHFNIGIGGLQTITPGSNLPSVSLPTVIDGTTQPGFAGTPLIEIDGANAGGDGLTISGGDSTVRGFVIHSFQGDGIVLRSDNNLIEANYIGTDPTGAANLGNQLSGVHISGGNNNLVGGTTIGARNLISGNAIAGILIEQAQGVGVAQGNMIRGNFIGTNAAGTGSIGNGDGVRIISAPNTVVGGETSGARNVISGNGSGISVSAVFNGNPIEGIVIQGNYIGTDVTGTAGLGNSGDGISLGTVNLSTIGGANASDRNVISANSGSGIFIANGAPNPQTLAGNLIQGNFIGTDAGGSADLGNSTAGILIFTGGANNQIKGNTIAFNHFLGVILRNDPGNTGDSILSNSIYSNSGLGIELNYPDGVTPNDLGDGDSGANNLQNFPVLTEADVSDGQISMVGTLNSSSNTQFTLQFFSNVSCDDSGNGEGQTFLGEQGVSTDANGNTSFGVPGFTISFPAAGGSFITATATRLNQGQPTDTSEFSNCIQETIIQGCGPDGTPCDDHNVCTQTDTCVNDVCTGSDPLICPASDVCHIAGPCIPGGAGGGQGDPCPPRPETPIPNCCITVADCPADDGNKCNGVPTCIDNQCGTSSAVQVPADTDCQTFSCDPQTGEIVTTNKQDGTSCNDGNACTTNDNCSGGACVGGAPPNCDDHNVCTNDSCNPASGCVHETNTNSCDDGNACTTDDVCSNGSCVGGATLSCDDGNTCTNDSCNPASGCVHENNVNSCNDSNACTTSDACSNGTCVGGAPLNCDDGNACTDDSCNPATGCQHSLTSVCNDNNPCTVDSCQVKKNGAPMCKHKRIMGCH